MPVRDVVCRATTAYYRRCVAQGELHPPAVSTATRVRHAGASYVVLAGTTGGILALYKIRQDGFLQRQYRWPHALEQAGHEPF